MKGLLFLILPLLLQVEGRTVLHKYGAITFTEAVTADVYDYGPTVNVYPFPAGPVSVELVSSSANDGAGDGSGCSTVLIEGLDSNGAIQTEIVTLTGITPAGAANPYLRLHRAHCLTAGSSQTNVGDVDVLGGGSVLARILAGKGETQMLIYTVPAGRRLLIGGITWSWSGNPGAIVDCGIFTRPLNGAWLQKGAFTLRNNVQPSPQVYTQRSERIIPGETDIRATCTAGIGTNVAVEIFGVIAESN